MYEHSNKTMVRATVGVIGSLNKLNPSIKSLYTLNSDLPDNYLKFEPKSIYKA